MLNTAIIGFCLYLITLSFAWLLLETNFLRVRLPCGRANKTPEIVEWINAECPKVIEQIPEPAKREYFNPCANLLPERCTLTLQHETMGKYATAGTKSTGYRDTSNILNKTSWQSLTIGNQTVTLNATLPNLYEYIDDARKAQNVKQSGGYAIAPCKQMPMFIENVRTGCEKVQHGERGGRRYYEYDDTYKTVYHDCLVSADWLKEHEHDLDDFTPTLEVSCNGQSLAFTPDNKTGDIKRFIGTFTKRVKVGRKTETVFEGYQILDCGGGVKIVTYPDQTPDTLDNAIDSLARERVAEAVND